MTREDRGMAPHPSPRSPQFSVAELSALRLDGDVRLATRDTFVPIAMPLNEVVRAEATAAWIPPGYAAIFTTAAWIHGALPREPSTYHAQLVENSPKGRVWRAGVVIRTWPIPEADLVSIGGVLVSGVERTFYDLARAYLTEPPNVDISRALAWFLTREHARERILAWLASGRRLRYTRMVAELVQDEVTRYTS